MQCEVCQSARLVIWATVANYDYYRCKVCKYLYVHPKPSAQEIEKYYQDARFYEQAESEEARLSEEAKRRMRLLTGLAQKYGLDKSLLDVGCASGIFLEQARAKGWLAEGIELSPVLASRARSKGFKVMDGRLEDLNGKGTYPVVTAWEVIEHAMNPANFLAKLRSHVQEGGLLALSTPLSNGIPARLLRSRFPMIYPPEHLSLFSRKSIVILGRHRGLKMVRFQSFSNLKRENLERGLFRFVFSRMAISDSIGKKVSSLLALMILPLPKMMDVMGAGTEMEVIFRSES